MISFDILSLLPVVGDRACKPERLEQMNDKEIPCLLWIDEAQVYAPVPESTIEALRAKGVTVLESKGLFVSALHARFFEIQRVEVVA